jgi:hypothetical protein
MEAKQNLIELLERIPQDAQLAIECDDFFHSVYAVGKLCSAAAIALRAAPVESEKTFWFEDWNGAVRTRPEDCTAWGSDGRPVAVWVDGVRYVPEKKDESECSP